MYDFNAARQEDRFGVVYVTEVALKDLHILKAIQNEMVIVKMQRGFYESDIFIQGYSPAFQQLKEGESIAFYIAECHTTKDDKGNYRKHHAYPLDTH